MAEMHSCDLPFVIFSPRPRGTAPIGSNGGGRRDYCKIGNCALLFALQITRTGCLHSQSDFSTASPSPQPSASWAHAKTCAGYAPVQVMGRSAWRIRFHPGMAVTGRVSRRWAHRLAILRLQMDATPEHALLSSRSVPEPPRAVSAADGPYKTSGAWDDGLSAGRRNCVFSLYQ